MLQAVPYRADPIATLAEQRERAWLGPSLVFAALVHAAAAFVLPSDPGAAREAAPITTEIIEIQPAAPPPTESPKPEPPPSAPSEPVKRGSIQPSSERTPSPPAAVPLLTQSSNENADLVDLTDSVVVGSATGSRGTGGRATSAPGPGSGVTNSQGAGSLSEPLGPNRARAASVWGESDWNCPFPPEADIDGVDRAVASLRVELNGRGAVNQVAILRDPGHGFGAAARRCALGKRYDPALDREGRPIPASLVLNVRFVR